MAMTTNIKLIITDSLIMDKIKADLANQLIMHFVNYSLITIKNTQKHIPFFQQKASMIKWKVR